MMNIISASPLAMRDRERAELVDAWAELVDAWDAAWAAEQAATERAAIGGGLFYGAVAKQLAIKTQAAWVAKQNWLRDTQAKRINLFGSLGFPGV